MRIKLKRFETDKVIIRKIKISDAAAMYEYAKKEEVGTNAGWEPHKSLHETKYILTLLKASREVWAISDIKTDKMIGTFSYKKWDKDKLEIGYALDSSYWRLGIMTDVVGIMVKHIFENRRVSEIICGHLVGNIGSKRVIEKNKFKFLKVADYLKYDGTYHEAWYYNLRREDLYEY